MKTTKIPLSKEDSAKDLAGYIASEAGEHLTFVIPNFSALGDAPEAFAMAKKVADAMGKSLAIESVDDAILAGAKSAGIPAENPFFSPSGAPEWEDSKPHFEDVHEDEPGDTPAVATPVVSRSRPVPKPLYKRQIRNDDDDDDVLPKKRGLLRDWRVWIAVLAVISVPAYWIAFVTLPHASIVITTEKKPWTFNKPFAVEKNGSVPSTLLSEKKNAQMVFPALGKKVVNQKATGKITVYNAYSSEPQQLVANTRFETPAGLLVRLTSSITIPGAKVSNGTITPSSIDADVIADKPGPAYNIAAPKLTIPGFKSSAKFSGFYGSIASALTGGFTGEAAYPTDLDVKSAKAKIGDVLEKSLMSQLSQKAGDYKVVSGSTQFTVTKTTVTPQVNGKGEFSLFAEAELKAVVFKESDLIGFFAAQMKDEFQSDSYVFKETTIAYNVSSVDFPNQKLKIDIDFKGVAERPVDIENVRRAVAGTTETELKTAIFAIQGVESAQVTLWPGYVKRVPARPTAENLSITLK